MDFFNLPSRDLEHSAKATDDEGTDVWTEEKRVLKDGWREKREGKMEKVCGVEGTDKEAVPGSRAVILSHWGQSEEPRGTDYATVLPSLNLRKSKIRASYHKKIQYVSNEDKDAVDNLALVLNIISPQEAEGREEILTEMFSDYILMTKSIHRWAISSEWS